MVAWHNDPELKQETLERLQTHRKLDHFIQGCYWLAETRRGCHLGCLAEDHIGSRGVHLAVKELFGIPQTVAAILEAVFESLPERQCAAWVLNSTEAIPVGADLSQVPTKMSLWLLEKSGLFSTGKVIREAIVPIRELLRRSLTEKIPAKQWEDARAAIFRVEEATLQMDPRRAEVTWLASAAYHAMCLAKGGVAIALAMDQAVAAQQFGRHRQSRAAKIALAWEKIGKAFIKLLREAPVPGVEEEQEERATRRPPSRRKQQPVMLVLAGH